jgi:hypothetical protein
VFIRHIFLCGLCVIFATFAVKGLQACPPDQNQALNRKERQAGPKLAKKGKEVLHPVDEAQLLSHLRLLNIPVGLLINFHVVLLKNGIKRMVNNYRELEENLLTARASNRKGR